MICKTCHKDKPQTDYRPAPSNAHGLSLHCTPCMNERARHRSYELGKTKPKPMKLSEDEIKARRKLYRQNNREKINKYYRDRRKVDNQYCMKRRLRRRADSVLTHRRFKHSELLGCSGADYVKYIEAKFLEGMSWDNKGEWEIDHITPLASFDLTNPDQQLEAFNYKNTQPLWREDNIRKGCA